MGKRGVGDLCASHLSIYLVHTIASIHWWESHPIALAAGPHTATLSLQNHCMVMPVVGLFFVGVLKGTCIVTQCIEKHIEKPTTTGTEGKEIDKSMEI